MTFGDNILWSSSNSKGDQTKLYKDGVLVKQDTHYEGLIESIVTQVLDNLKSPVEYVHYTPCKILDDYDLSVNGCQCENILKSDETDISLYKLLTYYSDNYSLIAKLNDSTYSTETKIQKILEVSDSFNVVNFREYLLWMLSIDSLVCNKDRHLRNVRVITSDFETFKPFPMFDFGDSLLQHYYDIMLRNEFPTSKIETILYNTKSKPFSTSFKSQVKAIENITEQKIVFPNSITIDTGILCEVYHPEIVELALGILKVQLEKYSVTVTKLNMTT